MTSLLGLTKRKLKLTGEMPDPDADADTQTETQTQAQQTHGGGVVQAWPTS